MKKRIHIAVASNTPNVTCFYDSEGRRVKKLSGYERTIFVYNSSGALVAEYKSRLTVNNLTAYQTADHLGSPATIVDGSGAVISRYDYQPFGEEIQRACYGADLVGKQFTGYERDRENDLDFAQARYYNSDHGRFTRVDPLLTSEVIKIPQVLNRYSYVINNPLKFIDPSGLCLVRIGCSQVLL